MNRDSRPRVRVGAPADLLAVIPHLLGFTPHASLVILGGHRASGRIEVALRFDLPDPPSSALSGEIAAQVAAVLARHHLTLAVAVGYGPGHLVTPLADALRQVFPRAGVTLHDLLRVQDGRYWSYLCEEPSCCPPSGTPVTTTTAHPAAAALAATGKPVLRDREALAATIAPLTGARAREMAAATRQAQRTASRLATRAGQPGLVTQGLAAVREAIRRYRGGGSITCPGRHAWLALALRSLRVRDDAWARMDPAHHTAHGRLWTDLVRRAQPGYVAAPACLLAVTAWQAGDGALANIALDRALADSPGYSMAVLLRDALASGAPPSLAVPPMTPEQVAASYAEAEPSQAFAGPDDGPADGS